MGLDKMKSATFASLQSEVYRRTGIHIDERKKTMILGRMRREARKQGFDNYEDYVASVKKAPPSSQEVDAFVDAVTTNKTSFFRTASLWRYLWEEFLPSRSDSQPLAFWSGASSSGEEAASMAMMCESFRAEHNPAFRYTILASDVSPAMVKAARAQRFDAAKVDAMKPPIPVESSRHFRAAGEGKELSSALRYNMQFRRHSLFEPIGRSCFDVVFVRNVIIYFTPEDKRKVLDLAITALRPGGIFVSGESESPLHHTERLEFVAPCIYRRTD